MCTGGGRGRQRGFWSIYNKNWRKNVYERRQGEFALTSNQNWIGDVYWRKKDAFGTHLAYWYDVPAQSYHFQGIPEIQWNSKKFNEIQRELNGLHTKCLYFIGSGNNYIPNHWTSFEFLWTSLNFLYSLKMVALRRHSVQMSQMGAKCIIPPPVHIPYSILIRYWCRFSLAPPFPSSTHFLYNSY